MISGPMPAGSPIVIARWRESCRFPRVEQLIVLEQITPQLPCTECSRFRDHVDAGPAAALQIERGSPGTRRPATWSAAHRARHSRFQGFAAGDDQRAGRIKHRSAWSFHARSVVPLLRATIRDSENFTSATRSSASFDDDPRGTSGVAFGQRDSGLAACLKLGRGDDLIGSEQSQHRPLQMARTSRRRRAPRHRPVHRSRTTGRARPRRPISTTRSRSRSLSASKT